MKSYKSYRNTQEKITPCITQTRHRNIYLARTEHVNNNNNNNNNNFKL